MNGQNIECTECHDIISLVGGSTITLPFVCNECVAQIDKRNEQRSRGLVIQECDNDECDCHASNQAAATPVEAEDISMEEVLGLDSRSKEELIEELNRLVEYTSDIEIQLQNARQEKLMAELQSTSLHEDNKYISQQNTEVNKQVSSLRQDLKVALAIAARLAQADEAGHV